MKRIALFALAIGLTLSACGGGVSVGEGQDFDFEESTSPTASPTVQATPTKTKAKESRKEEPKQKAPVCPDSGEIILRIETLGGGFEWKAKGATGAYQPTPFRVLQGCDVTFRNDDPEREHSWISGDNGTADAGTLWSSPDLKKGETWKLDTTTLTPGFHSCHDGVVPYIVCSVDVVARQ